jgi:hypothetical protein
LSWKDSSTPNKKSLQPGHPGSKTFAVFPLGHFIVSNADIYNGKLIPCPLHFCRALKHFCGHLGWQFFHIHLLAMMLQFFTDIVQDIGPFIGVELFDHPAQRNADDISMMKFAAEVIAQL